MLPALLCTVLFSGCAEVVMWCSGLCGVVLWYGVLCSEMMGGAVSCSGAICCALLCCSGSYFSQEFFVWFLLFRDRNKPPGAAP